ncbi:unnamed protein product [Anisakis simplex]|uniref:Hermansky-Pudlak syndrome 5 protein (inferred by orthology to a human protein) n=1 Tax=Anisakis simplex TaxID=6269 RepID=A0A0M3JW04_ANISI|nr:unnamed protein product [Anisakis simplex]
MCTSQNRLEIESDLCAATAAVTSVAHHATTSSNHMDNSSDPVERTHLFVELTSLDELSFPTSSSPRIKIPSMCIILSCCLLQYTCLDASPHYLAVGSTSGTIYLFSRYASKYIKRVSSVPIQVIYSKDGCVVKVVISPDEKYLASAGQRGTLSVSALSPVAHSPATIVTNNCHIGNVNASQQNHITEMRWSADSNKIYAGDLKGQVSCTRIQNRKLFRPRCDVLLETDSSIVQIDVHQDALLVSTLTRCCLCDLTTLNCIQVLYYLFIHIQCVGKKLRNGDFGAIFYPIDDKCSTGAMSNEQMKRETPNDNKAQLKSTLPSLIFASRPNARLWEANSEGVVYSTHQYRNLSNIARFPIVSFRESLSFSISKQNDAGKQLSFGRLHLIYCERLVYYYSCHARITLRFLFSGRHAFIVANDTNSLFLIDPADGRFVLVCDFPKDSYINEFAICGSDVFVLCGEKDKLRKLTLFTIQKAIEKLHWKQCFNQAAQVICALSTQIERSGVVPWQSKILRDIINGSQQQALQEETSSSVQPLDRSINEQQQILRRIVQLKEQKLSSTSTKDDRSCGPRQYPSTVIHRLNTGIHRVVRIMDNSGYEDDFTFRAPSPLRQRSKSTPNMDSSVKMMAWKRKSLPLRENNVRKNDESRNGGEEEGNMRKQLIQEAFHLLDTKRSSQTNSGSTDSLRTLLACGEQRITFHSEVTVVDVPKDLMAAKQLLRVIANSEHRNRTVQSPLKSSNQENSLRDDVHSPSQTLLASTSADFTSLFGREDPLQRVFSKYGQISASELVRAKEPVNVERRVQVVKRPKKTGARIVRAIKPLRKIANVCETTTTHLKDGGAYSLQMQTATREDSKSENKLECVNDGVQSNGISELKKSEEPLNEPSSTANDYSRRAELLNGDDYKRERISNSGNMNNLTSSTDLSYNSNLLTNNSNDDDDDEKLEKTSTKMIFESQPRCQLESMVNGIHKTHPLNLPFNGATLLNNHQSDATNTTPVVNNSDLIVERNFITDKRIRVSWSMTPSSNENNVNISDIVVCNDRKDNVNKDELNGEEISEKDDISEDSDERLMELSEITLEIPSTLQTSQQTSTTYNDNDDRCHVCSLHRSWLVVMAFGVSMSQLKVTEDNFNNGGVPSCKKQWYRLFVYYMKLLRLNDGRRSSSTDQLVTGSNKLLCDECSAFFDISLHLKNNISTVSKCLHRAQRRNNTDEKRTRSIMRKLALAFDESQSRELFFKTKYKRGKASHPTQTSTVSALIASSSVEPSASVRKPLHVNEEMLSNNPPQNSDCDSSASAATEKNHPIINVTKDLSALYYEQIAQKRRQLSEKDMNTTVDDELPNFDWISALTISQVCLFIVSFDFILNYFICMEDDMAFIEMMCNAFQLLFCMRLSEGIDAIFELLNTNKAITTHLTQQDWQWLALLKADRWKRIMPRQVLYIFIVKDVLCDLNIKSVEDVCSVPGDSTDPKNALSDRSSFSKQQSNNMIIAVDGNCPCCTLPLKGRVSDTDCFIIAFRCGYVTKRNYHSGHSYHKVCLKEASISRCIRCEIERRRHRLQHSQAPTQHQQYQRSSLNSSSSSNSSRIQTIPSAINSTQLQRHAPVRSARVNVSLTSVPRTFKRT